MSQNKQDTILIFIFKVIMKIKLLKMAKTNISRPKQWNLLEKRFQLWLEATSFAPNVVPFTNFHALQTNLDHLYALSMRSLTSKHGFTFLYKQLFLLV